MFSDSFQVATICFSVATVCIFEATVAPLFACWSARRAFSRQAQICLNAKESSCELSEISRRSQILSTVVFGIFCIVLIVGDSSVVTKGLVFAITFATMVLCLCDLSWRLIPREITAFVFVCGLLLQIESASLKLAFYSVIEAAMITCVCLIAARVHKRRWGNYGIGGGDLRAILAYAVASWPQYALGLFAMLFSASLCIFIKSRIKRQRQTSSFAVGPFFTIWLGVMYCTLFFVY